jgi:GT2 family glycosyltransferase
MKKISVVIATWNSNVWLEACLLSLQKQTFRDFELIVVDNNSENRPGEIVKRFFPEAKIINLKSNLGYAGGNNQGAKEAESDFLFFLNPDTKVQNHCLWFLVKSAIRDKRTGIWACRQLSYDGRKWLNDGVGYDFLGCPVVGKIFYADGASLFMSKRLFDSLGGFDRSYFLVAEDIDLCWKARLRGFGIKCNKKAIVYHFGGASFVGGSKSGKRYITSIFRRYFGERNNFRNLLKNYSWQLLIFILPIYAVFNISECVVFFFLGRLDVCRNVYIKSWRSNLREIREILEKRKAVQSFRQVNDLEILRHMEIKIGKVAQLLKVGFPVIKSQ